MTAIIFNSLLTVVLITLFIFVHKKAPVFKTGTFYSIIIFILLSVFLGRTLNFYERVPHWDKMLHFLSGFIIASAGKEIYIKIKGDMGNKLLLNLFVLFFAVAVAGLWEIYEFTGDSIFGTEFQNNSLADTMTDIIAGSVSALMYLIFQKVR